MKNSILKIFSAICITAAFVMSLSFSKSVFFGVFTEKAEASVPAYSDDVQQGDWICRKKEPNDEGYTIAMYMGSKTDLIIPESIAGTPVVALDAHSLSGVVEYENDLYYNNDKLSNLENLVIKPDIVSLGTGVCAFDENLKTVKMNRCEIIGDKAFYGCSSLTDVSINGDVYSIGSECFKNCESLKTLSLPTVVSVGDHAFDNTGITQFYASERLVNIGQFAFNGIRVVSFAGSKMDFKENSLAGIGNVVFGSPIKIDSENIFGSGEDFALKSVVFQAQPILSDELFKVFSKVDEVYFYTRPDIAVFETLENEFYCGHDVRTDHYIFSKHPIENEYIVPVHAAEGFLFYAANNEAYIFACDQNAASIDIPSTLLGTPVVHLWERLFFNNKNISHVSLPDGLKTIGKEVFYNCKIENIVLPQSLESIGMYAFCNSALTEIYIPDSVEKIESYAFKNCTRLKKVMIGGNISAVNSQAFASCENLETALISDNVKKIAEDAFDGCNKLTIVCTENSYAFDYANANGIPVTTFVIAPIPNQVYTGFEIKPAIKVSVSGKQLTENIDYVSTYSNNINVGTAKVKVTGKGEYRVFASTANYAIITKDISLAKISPIADVSYTGKPVTPEIVVTDGANVLKEGTDYQVSCKNNVEAGKATVTVKGIGNYKGEQECEFNIVGQQTMLQKIANALTGAVNRLLKFALTIFGWIVKK